MRNYSLAVGSTLLVTLGLWLLRPELTLANFSLIYLLLVVVISTQLGIRAAILATLLSFALFNFFLIAPLYTFRVADSRELLDLLIFLAVAFITGQLAARLKQQVWDTQQRAREQDILYQLTSSVNQLTTPEAVHTALQQVFEQELGAQQYRLLPQGSPQYNSDLGFLYLLLNADQAIYGIICAAFSIPLSPSQERLAKACAMQGAMALQRIELAERAQHARNLEEADALKTALLHAVSHDLRTPITIIKTSASNLLTLQAKLSTVEQHEMLQTIEAGADTLNTMVGNLLDMSRLRAGALQMNLAWNSLEEVAGDVAARFWALTHMERVALDFSDDFPLARFDYGLILQAVGNIVENAIRYEPPEAKVQLQGRLPNSDMIHLAIINHGPAIPFEERAKIMEPFYHGSTGGTGLGLAIAKGIVEAHHGQLWIEDTPNGGATFVVALPYQPLVEDAFQHEDSNRG